MGIKIEGTVRKVGIETIEVPITNDYATARSELLAAVPDGWQLAASINRGPVLAGTIIPTETQHYEVEADSYADARAQIAARVPDGFTLTQMKTTKGR